MDESVILAVLQAFEDLPPAAALRRSFVAYPLVNALHILALGALATTVALMDLRVLGRMARFEGRGFVAALRPLALAAFAVAVATGLALFSIRASEYAFNPAFLSKLALIALAGLNLALFDAARGGASPGFSDREKLSAGLSLVLWPAIVIAGRFIGFV